MKHGFSSVAFFAILLMSDLAWAQQTPDPESSGNFYLRREARLNFDGVDLTNLYEEGRKRNPKMAGDRLERMVKDNIHFVFFNKLNRNRFLVTPAPRRVVRKVETILDLNDQLQSFLGEARVSLGPGASFDERRKMIRAIDKTARTLGRTFSEYFSEFSTGPYLLQLTRDSTADRDFRFFLAESEQIALILSRRLDRYFFTEAPSVVDASEYESHSVEVLCEALHQLSEIVLKRIK